ncbi:unnamed protein product [Miscanthus lutarioriparius]|uniref:Leucine-rich repeat-containing N-terminal plant-type domain-containing protein n=1 Tax=Miscanthus lutarioriparius TaxID=422564 RepID=A0A811PG37_9POAL|nr:unnamed protein product [Miscanthus lutarioriparius]
MGQPKQPAKLAMFIALPLLLLCYEIGNIRCSTVHENCEDFQALVEFKQGITDPKGVLYNWNPDTHFCQWNGVNCSSERPYSVVYLSLTGQNLGGQISSSIGNLTFLGTLDLSNNSFHGPRPPLNKLQHLTTLHLKSNHLQGFIPDTLTNCSNLADLDLSGNNFTGVIPPRIGSLTNLASITLDSNYLTGGIPAALGNITTLQVVSFTQNRLNGKIPHEELSLTSNMLGNKLPSNIGDALPNLTILFLADNNFDGHIPASLGNPKGLENLDLSSNHFTGQIPSSIGNLSQLQLLSLEGNMLQSSTYNEGWEFLQALGNCRSLSVLSLSDNKLQGSIPNSIANLPTNLTRLLMGGNSLSGIVPPSIGKLSALIQLSLDENNLTGKIEEWVGNLTKLQHLNLQSNRFNGTIPPSIGHLTQLIYFSLAENQFTSNLKTLSILNLSHNNLSGLLPVYLNDLESLTKLDLSCNNFRGEIPANGVFDNATIVSLDGNPGLCGGATNLHMSSCHVVYRREKEIINYMVKILVPVFGFISLIMFIYITIHGKKMPRKQHVSFLSFGKKFPRVSYKDLEQDTGRFSKSNLIGRGSYGSVYKGKLTQAKIEVAIKVFDLEIRFADKSFVSEVNSTALNLILILG